jgi:hypothetical protein
MLGTWVRLTRQMAILAPLGCKLARTHEAGWWINGNVTVALTYFLGLLRLPLLETPSFFNVNSAKIADFVLINRENDTRSRPKVKTKSYTITPQNCWFLSNVLLPPETPIMILPLLFCVLAFLPHFFLKTKLPFTPTPRTTCNGVKNVERRHIYPCEYAPTVITTLWFYPYLDTIQHTWTENCKIIFGAFPQLRTIPYQLDFEEKIQCIRRQK